LETKISGKFTAWFFTATIHQALHEHKMENILMRNGTALQRDQKTKISPQRLENKKSGKSTAWFFTATIQFHSDYPSGTA